LANKPASPRYPDALKPDEQVGKYIIQDVLGSGGFGITYGAIEKGRPRKRYALKEFFVREVCSREGNEVVLFGNVKPEDRDNYKKALSKFEEEAAVLREFSHRSIVRSLDFFEANNTAYIVMEFVRGRDLSSWLSSRNSPLRERQVKEIFERILDAVKYIHDRDFMHRDLSPENIMITRRNNNDVPVLIDFGTMGEGLDRIRSRSLQAYRPEYSPPEQTIHRTEQGAFTDIFALGGILFRTIAGRPPVDPQSRYLARVNDEPDPYVSAAQSATDPSLYSTDFLEAIDAALAIMPNERPANIAEFRAMLGWSTSKAKGKSARQGEPARLPATQRMDPPTRKAAPRTKKKDAPPEPDAQPMPVSAGRAQPDTGERAGTSPLMIFAILAALAITAGAAYLFAINPQGWQGIQRSGGSETGKTAPSQPGAPDTVPQRKARTAQTFLNIHFAGRVLSTTNQSSSGSCEVSCMGSDRCVAFSFAASGQCTAFTSVNEVKRDTSATSGVDRANAGEVVFITRRIGALVAAEDQRRTDRDAERRRRDQEDNDRRRAEEQRRADEQRKADEAAEQRRAQQRRDEEERRRVLEQNKTRIAEYLNVDFFGDDVDSPPGRVTSNATQCARACLGHGSCRAFTYNQGKRAGSRNCFLKGGSGIPTQTTGSVSYFIYRGSREDAPNLQLEFDIKYNVDYPFNDLHKNIIRSSNLDACRASCSARSDCAGFSFVRGSNQCWLKGSLRNVRQKRGVTSGVKRQVISLSPNRVLEQ